MLPCLLLNHLDRHFVFVAVLVVVALFECHGHPVDHRYDYHHRTKSSSSSAIGFKTDLTDFRYDSCSVDGITKLFNGSLIVISNGYYWILNGRGELPLMSNVKGNVKELYDGFKNIDAIWTDPYNDVGQQLYLLSNSKENGLQVVCKEFDDEPFVDDSSFCHLPVDKKWYMALKDVDPNLPINAVTWRNRTKNQDGGFWVFFQGRKMITIDPYEMNLRYTYDIKKWMSINESMTAVMYDYLQNTYHLFFDNNKYYQWKVNVSYMNRLPMGWDRAFLHGTLSPRMKINRDFFGFADRDLIDGPQPYYIKIKDSYNQIFDNDLFERKYETSKENYWQTMMNKFKKTTTTITTTKITTSKPPPINLNGQILKNFTNDVVYIPFKHEQKIYIPKTNDNFPKKNVNDKNSRIKTNLVSSNYQRQLMQLDRNGVRDFRAASSSDFYLESVTRSASSTAQSFNFVFIVILIQFINNID